MRRCAGTFENREGKEKSRAAQKKDGEVPSHTLSKAGAPVGARAKRKTYEAGVASASGVSGSCAAATGVSASGAAASGAAAS